MTHEKVGLDNVRFLFQIQPMRVVASILPATAVRIGRDLQMQMLSSTPGFKFTGPTTTPTTYPDISMKIRMLRISVNAIAAKSRER